MEMGLNVFAKHKPWARRWAHSTPSYHALPRNKKGNVSVSRKVRAALVRR